MIEGQVKEKATPKMLKQAPATHLRRYSRLSLLTIINNSNPTFPCRRRRWLGRLGQLQRLDDCRGRGCRR